MVLKSSSPLAVVFLIVPVGTNNSEPSGDQDKRRKNLQSSSVLEILLAWWCFVTYDLTVSSRNILWSVTGLLACASILTLLILSVTIASGAIGTDVSDVVCPALLTHSLVRLQAC